MSLADEPRLVNVQTGASHGVSADDPLVTICGIETRESDAGYEPDFGEFGDMSCGRCRGRLDRACAALLRDVLEVAS